MFEKLGIEIESYISNFSTDLSTTLIANLFPIISTCVILYLTLKGYLFLSGRAQGAISDTVITAFKIAIIAYIGLNTGNFINFGLGTLNSFESFLASSLPISSSTSWAMIDQLWLSIVDSVSGFMSIISKLGISNIGFAFLVVFIFIIYLFIAAILTTSALGVLIMAKISLILVSGFGPLFICLLMFPLTRSWFDGWLRACLTYIFTLVMMAALISLVIIIFEKQIQEIVTHLNSTNLGEKAAGTNLIIKIFGFLIICLALTSLIKMVPAMAAGIVGGVAMQAVGLGAMLTSTSAGAVNLSMAATLGAGHLSRSNTLKNVATSYLNGNSALGKAIATEGGLGAYTIGAGLGGLGGGLGLTGTMSKYGYIRAKRAIKAAINK